MALNLEQKKAVVAEVNEVAASALSVVAAEYRGLTVEELTELRVKSIDAGVKIRVVKNSLARKAFAETGFACMNEVLTGPIILGFSQEDPGGAARVMKDFAKDHDKFVVKGLSLGETFMDPSQLATVASLPTYDQAISQLMSVMKAPIEKFVRTLVAPHTKVVRTILAVKDAKEAA
ncbi:MAG: 50S ribosomal protein L10 [Thiotrichales bacterium]|jgi:large subunit ribosomal protein L10|nr:50S ribosomal protein L10 [Thiotrichales bacterium]MBT3612809.1 50S ribosomal protein L10 [Thiotrichales bacterium]MBT3752656.1 50S ribosomal protein L10 [Thiotrichales bacterium]MBT3837104.1 50S ribosomal protein L10 [Thiotrichales bacterium]MBT4152800.1 50S ribosomal protein L10 [Thiotrichales bacterium]